MAAPPASRLDGNQVLQGSFDEATGTLRTTAEATIVNADIDVALDAAEDNVAIADPNGDFLEVNADGSINVNDEDVLLELQSFHADTVSESNQTQVILGAIDTSLNNIEADSDATRITTESLNTKTNNNYGVATGAIRTASQIGSVTGAADFGVGSPTAQTLRTASNNLGIDPNGTVTENRESGKIDSNSSITPLLAGATFTGAWVDASNYSCISFTANSDVDSAVNGLRLQFSHNAVDIIRQSPTTLIGSPNGVFFSFPVHATYFRIFYQNGAVNQTRFQLDTHLHEEFNGLAAIPLDTPLNDKSSVTSVKSIIAGKAVDGVYVNQRASGVSTLNSTAIPLGPAAIFTGTFEDVIGFASIAITVFSNVDSTTDGLIAEFSSDGINVDHADFYTVPAGLGTQFTFGVTTRYFRVRYINGGSAQVAFRLSTLYNLQDIKASSIRIDDSITGQNDAELVKSISTGKNPDGVFVNDRSQGYETTNSFTTPLAANAIYRGEWVKWSESYLNLLSVVVSDVAGTLYIDASDDPAPANGTDANVTHFATENYQPSLVPVLRRNTPLQSIWVRHRYINGPAAQSNFTLVAMFTTADPGLVYKAANNLPTLTTLSGIVRSIGTVRSADGMSFQDIPIDPLTGDQKVTVQTIRDDILLKPMTTTQVEQGVVSITPVRIDPSPLLNRRKVRISNDGSDNCAIGFDSGITYSSASFVLKADKEVELDLDASVELWAVAEDAGGVTTDLRRSGTTAGGTGTNPSNALTSNDVHADITANGQTITVEGFTAGTANPLVSVKMGIEGRKQPGQFETVTYVSTNTGNAGNVGSVSTTAAVTAAIGDLYIAAVSRENVNALITGVTGLGLGWTQVATAVNGANRSIDVWYAIGIPSGSTVVTANFSNTAVNSHIAVSRYSNVDLSTPIQDFKTNTANSAAATTLGVNGTVKGMSYMAVAMDNNTFTAGAGYTERSDEVTPAGGSRDGLATETKPLTITASEVPTGTISGAVQYAAISLTLLPKAAVDIQISLSYELSAVPGATSGVSNFVSSIVDIEGIVDITGDEPWTVADIPNIKVIATGLVIGAAAAQVDYIFLDLVDTTGNATRISILQTGRSF